MAFPLAGSATTPPIFPTGSATPNPAYSGTFIPEIWSGKLIEKFYASPPCWPRSRTPTTKARSRTRATRSRSAPSRPSRSATTAPTARSTSSVRPANVIELLIDKGKYFNTILDDVMDVQSDLNLMSMWSDDAAEQMKIVIDRRGAAGPHRQGRPDNRGATAGKISRNINLGVTGTPLPVVAAQPDRRQGRDRRLHPPPRSGARRAEHPGDGPLDRDADVGRLR